MKEATILYRPGTGEVIWGIPLDTKIVDAHEVEEHLDDGWYRHPFEARDAAEAANQGDGLRTDGPTIAEFVAAGYRAENYPPEGYASRSTDEEVKEAIEAQQVVGDGGASTSEQPAAEPGPAADLSLADQAKALGIKVDGRWSEERLAKEIEEAKAAKAAE